MTWRNYEIAVHESGRTKTMHIVIERDGTLAVQVPKGMAQEKIVAVLDRRSYAIFKMLAKWKDAHDNTVERNFVDGERFPFHGKNYKLRFIEGGRLPVEFNGREFLIDRNVKDPRRALIAFYHSIATIDVQRRIEIFARYFKASEIKVQIRDMRTRWGSCTPGGTLTYNWRCALVPLRVLDYLVVHELTHLEYHRHSREFWSKIASRLPDYEASVEWLRKNGIRTEF